MYDLNTCLPLNEPSMTGASKKMEPYAPLSDAEPASSCSASTAHFWKGFERPQNPPRVSPSFTSTYHFTPCRPCFSILTTWPSLSFWLIPAHMSSSPTALPWSLPSHPGTHNFFPYFWWSREILLLKAGKSAHWAQCLWTEYNLDVAPVAATHALAEGVHIQ